MSGKGKLRKLVSEERLTQIGMRIRTLRKNKGLTIEQLAQKLDVTKQYIASCESNLGVITVPSLMAISDALGVSPNVILGYDDRFNKYIEELEAVENKYRNMNW